nr:MAG TPA: hypothetical protein [Caudoviricetes sp.]
MIKDFQGRKYSLAGSSDTRVANALMEISVLNKKLKRPRIGQCSELEIFSINVKKRILEFRCKNCQ